MFDENTSLETTLASPDDVGFGYTVKLDLEHTDEKATRIKIFSILS